MLNCYLTVHMSHYESDGDRANVRMTPLLVAAASKHNAIAISDTYIEVTDFLSNEGLADHVRDRMEIGLECLLPQVCEIDTLDDFDRIRTSIERQGAKLKDELETNAGGAFTVEINEDNGFSPDTVERFWGMMSGHFTTYTVF